MEIFIRETNWQAKTYCPLLILLIMIFLNQVSFIVCIVGPLQSHDPERGFLILLSIQVAAHEVRYTKYSEYY